MVPLVKIYPLLLVAVSGGAIVLREIGVLSDTVTSIVMIAVIIFGIAIGIHRSTRAKR